jgi:hypothetical protein
MHAVLQRKPAGRCNDTAPPRRQERRGAADRLLLLGNQARLARLRAVPRACAECEQEKAPHSLSDDNFDTDLPFPRALGTPEGDPAPAPPIPEGPTATPMDGGTTADCCESARTQHLDRGDYGGIICCNGTKKTCVWQANIDASTASANARSILGRCIGEHESTHLGQVDCTGAAVERPNFRAGVDANASECVAYRTEGECLTAHKSECGDDTVCQERIARRITFTQQQRVKFCGS